MTILGNNLTLKFRSIATKLLKFKPVQIGRNCVEGLIYVSEEFYIANTVIRAAHVGDSPSRTVRNL